MSDEIEGEAELYADEEIDWEAPDPEPISEQEEAYGRAYWEHLALAEPEPDASGLDPERAARIREHLLGEWRAKVRRITHPAARSFRRP